MSLPMMKIVSHGTNHHHINGLTSDGDCLAWHELLSSSMSLQMIRIVSHGMKPFSRSKPLVHSCLFPLCWQAVQVPKSTTFLKLQIAGGRGVGGVRLLAASNFWYALSFLQYDSVILFFPVDLLTKRSTWGNVNVNIWLNSSLREMSKIKTWGSRVGKNLQSIGNNCTGLPI